MSEKLKKEQKKERLKPISLYPLEVEEALEDILQIKPETKNKKPNKNKQ